VFKTREILKAAHKDVKKHFWMYLAVVLLFGVISGFVDGAGQMFANISNLIASLRTNMLGNYSLAPDMLLGTTAVAGGLGFFGVVISIFLINPLEVGLSKFFLEGTKDKPKWETLFSIFSNRYINVVGVMLLKNLLLGALTFAISFAFLFLIMICASVIAVVFEYLYIPVMAVRITVAAFCSVVALAAFVVYIALLVNISYNFSMINYIVSENTEMSFSECYNLSKQIVKGNKFKIFKVDFVYSFIVMLAIFVPCFLIISGALIAEYDNFGIALLLAGLLAIIPVLFLNLFVSLFQKSAWANMYLRLKKPEEKEEIHQEENVYEAPKKRKPISYAPNEDENNDQEEI